MYPRLLIGLFLLTCWSCRPKPAPETKASSIALKGYRFHQPCGEPVLSGNLSGGYYFAYVLSDSLQVADCVGKITPPAAGDPLPLQSRDEFLLVLEAPAGSRMALANMAVTDSMLHIHLRPDAGTDTTRIWKINGQGVKLIRLMADPLHYAYVPGPAWNGTPPQLRRAHWKE
ncbi:hypothetical protein EGT74_04035 [Chitinophaga lutea]|uniref:Uncharacterized protein n=1 Tax=Chitinophaga lutea TaxID=2488634 RepID=A0A3N4PV98_9BACT|nr:hypothetical protein [Chitinophaga lutea]RPE12723.1 hypothetical protein EGT74_04035 [Chitinophaga lutea]